MRGLCPAETCFPLCALSCALCSIYLGGTVSVAAKQATSAVLSPSVLWSTALLNFVESARIISALAMRALTTAFAVLNFLNAIPTSVAARRELAVFEAIVMTNGQRQTMLALEGRFSIVDTLFLALVLIVATAPFADPALNGRIWFLTEHFTIGPIAVVLPLFGALGILIPVLNGRTARCCCVVDRLRQQSGEK